jgi:small subunit ribosomal protein S6
MTKYELLYILPSRYTDVEVGEIQKKIDALLVQAGGTVTKEANLGKIRLAYPIKHARHGTYILVYFDAETEVARTLDAQLRLTDEVLRHILLSAPKGAESQKWELQSYVAPLSEEETETRPVRSRVNLPPLHPPVSPRPLMTSAKPMSLEELDKKLDEILETGTGNV